MQKHTIKFYPVGNGDTCQIVLTGGQRILLDYCHRKKAEEESSPEIELASELKAELIKSNTDRFDVVAFTHADLDHIQGSTEFFHLEHAAKYQGDGRIRIGELWVPAAMLIEESERDKQSEEFVVLRQEARHRLIEGVGIRVFSKPKKLLDWLEPKLKEKGEAVTARDHLFVDAGTVVPTFSLETDAVEFFTHSPFIKHTDEGDVIRNSAALVFSVRFRADSSEYNYLAVGDAEWNDLEDIVSITRYHERDDRLSWNLYNIPHHCSYTALSDEKGDKETIPSPLVKELLLEGQKDSYMVSSSKPITDVQGSYAQTQPPHIQARNCYEKHLRDIDGRKFLVTMEEPNGTNPKPIVFEIGSGGITRERTGQTGAPAVATSKPPRAGTCRTCSMK